MPRKPPKAIKGISHLAAHLVQHDVFDVAEVVALVVVDGGSLDASGRDGITKTFRTIPGRCRD